MKLIKYLTKKSILRHSISLLTAAMFLTACAAQPTALPGTPAAIQTTSLTPEAITATPLPTREVYGPGTLVDYTVQDGDTLPALAAHFNTTIKEIRDANPSLPAQVTTLPPGMPMKIPIYYKALWGNPYHILPDSLFVNGPAEIGFDVVSYVNSQPGWLKNYTAFAGNVTRTGGEVIDYLATEYSINPRLLLAIAEYQAGALTQPALNPDLHDYTLGYQDKDHIGFYLQLNWAANILNNGFYEWGMGTLDTINRQDGTLEHPDPWQNAATVALQNYFSQVLPIDQYNRAIYSNGLSATYARLFGDPWSNVQPVIPGSLTQPTLTLPFPAGKTWAFTGAPHSGWGTGDPLAAMDFAPPSSVGGCAPTAEFAVAVAGGEVVRTEKGVVALDLDGDGNENTGWVILYLHIADADKVRQGQMLKAGDPIGHPSCEGGEATGTHVHIARKYNGQWIPADSPIPFVMDGWTPHDGSAAYFGSLTKNGYTVIASDKAASGSMITAGN